MPTAACPALLPTNSPGRNPGAPHSPGRSGVRALSADRFGQAAKFGVVISLSFVRLLF